jgi:predicted nucleic acid-binding protein
MVDFYLDASVIVPVILVEAHTPLVNAWVRANTAYILVSDLAAAEVSSALSLAVRTGRTTEVEADELLLDFDGWRSALNNTADLEPVDIKTADAFVRRFDLKLRTPDAIHAATAHRIGATLITLDRRLLAAADALGIAAASPIAAHT